MGHSLLPLSRARAKRLLGTYRAAPYRVAPSTWTEDGPVGPALGFDDGVVGVQAVAHQLLAAEETLELLEHLLAETRAQITRAPARSSDVPEPKVEQDSAPVQFALPTVVEEPEPFLVLLMSTR